MGEGCYLHTMSGWMKLISVGRNTMAVILGMVAAISGLASFLLVAVAMWRGWSAADIRVGIPLLVLFGLISLIGISYVRMGLKDEAAGPK